MRYIIFLAFMAIATNASSQSQGNIWVFGKGAGISFNTGNPVSFPSAITGYGEGSASIADAAGQLLFYTEGTDVWDRNHNLMPNGTNLTSLPYITINPTSPISPTSSTTQGSLIVPVPYQAGRYYIFSLSSQKLEMGTDGGKLYYSVVDMSLNGGLGDVVPGSKGILLHTGLDEKMTAMLGDRCNIWVITHQNNSTLFKSFEITAAGINPVPVVSNAGSANLIHYTLGTLKVSPDRKKLISCNSIQLLFASLGSLELFDIDAATGIVSNGKMIDNLATYGAAFSPSSSRLYVSRSNSGQIHQYDVTLAGAAAIAASRTLVGTISFTDLKLAPDGKIYAGGTSTGGQPVNSISVIAAPDSPPASCGFALNAVPLAPATSFAFGLPNDVVVFRQDTMRTTRSIQVCFRNDLELLGDTLNIGWDHVWNTAATGRAITVNTSGTYVINYTTAPCVFHADTFHVSFDSPFPTLVSVPGCKGQSNGYVGVTSAAGDTTQYTYTWANSADSTLRQVGPKQGDTLFTSLPDTYSVHITGSNGCDTTLQIALTAPQYQAAFSIPPFICITDTLRPVNLSSGFSSYAWDFGDGTSSANAKHIYTQPGAYTVTLTGTPCQDTAVRWVMVDTMSYVRFTTDSMLFCEGAAIIFYPEMPGGADSLRWHFGADVISSGIDAIAHAFDTSGIFPVTVQAFFRACPDTSYTNTVDVHPYPRVQLGRDTTLCINAQPLPLNNLAATAGTLTYTWNTGESQATIWARHPGIYALGVTNEWGCTTTDSIEIFKGCYLDIPNAFTPNGDGNNDYFLPRQLLSHGLTSFHMQILNRWGKLIFETTHLDGRGWDGNYNGVPQPDGVYVYLVEASFENGYSEKYKGNVTLLR